MTDSTREERRTAWELAHWAIAHGKGDERKLSYAIVGVIVEEREAIFKEVDRVLEKRVEELEKQRWKANANDDIFREQWNHRHWEAKHIRTLLATLGKESTDE